MEGLVLFILVFLVMKYTIKDITKAVYLSIGIIAVGYTMYLSLRFGFGVEFKEKEVPELYQELDDVILPSNKGSKYEFIEWDNG